MRETGGLELASTITLVLQANRLINFEFNPMFINMLDSFHHNLFTFYLLASDISRFSASKCSYYDRIFHETFLPANGQNNFLG